MTTETDYDRITVAESGRVAVVATFSGDTRNITVRRADGGGKRLTVRWNDALGSQENYAHAVRLYLVEMGWGGRWTVGATRTGAVATWSGWAD